MKRGLCGGKLRFLINSFIFFLVRFLLGYFVIFSYFSFIVFLFIWSISIVYLIIEFKGIMIGCYLKLLSFGVFCYGSNV